MNDRLNEQEFIEDYKKNIQTLYSVDLVDATGFEKYAALSRTVMDLIAKDWIKSRKQSEKSRKEY